MLFSEFWYIQRPTNIKLEPSRRKPKWKSVMTKKLGPLITCPLISFCRLNNDTRSWQCKFPVYFDACFLIFCSFQIICHTKFSFRFYLLVSAVRMRYFRHKKYTFLIRLRSVLISLIAKNASSSRQNTFLNIEQHLRREK